MSQGKYSPALVKKPCGEFNCYGMKPEPWNQEVANAGVVYDEKTMFNNYDEDGYDSYGYSAFDEDGNFVGFGNGVDRKGYTESEYLCMSAEQYQDMY